MRNNTKIRLTESQLHQIVKESTMTVLNEMRYEGLVLRKLIKALTQGKDDIQQLYNTYEEQGNKSLCRFIGGFYKELSKLLTKAEILKDRCYAPNGMGTLCEE